MIANVASLRQNPPRVKMFTVALKELMPQRGIERNSLAHW